MFADCASCLLASGFTGDPLPLYQFICRHPSKFVGFSPQHQFDAHEILLLLLADVEQDLAAAVNAVKVTTKKTGKTNCNTYVCHTVIFFID